MSYGKMTVPIVISRVYYSKDADGFRTEMKEPVASVRAYFEPKNATEKWENRTVLKEASALFRFRRIPDLRIDASMVIDCIGEQYNIITVENVRQRDMYYEVIGKVVEPSGKVDSETA